MARSVYLKSAWRDRRRRHLDANPGCYVCGARRGLHCHHRWYSEKMGQETDEQLVTLCRGHHEELHALVRRGEITHLWGHLALRARWVQRPVAWQVGGGLAPPGWEWLKADIGESCPVGK